MRANLEINNWEEEKITNIYKHCTNLHFVRDTQNIFKTNTYGFDKSMLLILKYEKYHINNIDRYIVYLLNINKY